MDWYQGILIFCVYLCLTQNAASTQYVRGNIRGNCQCSNVLNNINVPVANLPLANVPLTNVPLNTLPLRNQPITLGNGCGCNANNIAINNLIHSNLPVNRYLKSSERLAIACNDPQAINCPVQNMNIPIGRIRVPVDKRSIGDLPINGNLPIANILNNCNGQSLNSIQVTSSIPINYRSIAGMPINNVARLPCNSKANLPLIQNIANRNLDGLQINNNFANVPINNLGNYLNNRVVSINNVANLNNGLGGMPYLANLQTNLANIPINNFANLPINNVARVPLNELSNLRINLASLPNNNVITNTGNIITNLPINNISPSAQNPSCGCQQSVPNGKILANVPVVPLTSLANLPAYNGMPVIKVSESTYKLTPIS